MFCKNCGNEIAPTEKFCAKCGTRVQFESADNVNPTEPTTKQPENTEFGIGNAENGSAQPTESFGVVSHVGEGISVKKPKGKGKKLFLMVCLPLILVLAVAFSVYANPVWRNSVFRMVMSDKSYFKYVMGNAINDGMSDISSDLRMIQNVIDGKKTVSSKMELEIGTAGKDLINKYGGEEVSNILSMFDSFGLSFDAGRNGNTYGLGLGLILNGSEAVKAESVLTNDGLYVSVPQLNDQAVYVAVGDNVDIGQISEVLDKIRSSFPSEAVISNIVKRYCLCVVNSFSDIAEEDITIEAGGVKQNAVGMTVKMNGKTFVNIACSCVEELKKDNDIKGIIKKACENGLIQQDFDSVYNSFVAAMDEALKELNQSNVDPDFESAEFEIRFIANNRGQLIGADIDIEGVEIKAYNTENGGKYGSLITMKINGVEIKYEADGTINGGKYNGEGTLSVMGMGILDIKLDNVDKAKYDRGSLDGKVTLSSGSGVKTLVSMAGMANKELASAKAFLNMLPDMEIVVEASCSSDYKGSSSITANYKDKKFGSLIVDYDITKRKNYIAPKSYVDSNNSSAMQSWSQKCLENIYKIKEFAPFAGMLMTGEF